MGWTYYTDQRVKTHADERAEIERLCTFSNDLREGKMIKASKVGSTWYAAVRLTGNNAAPIEDRTYVTARDGSITFAVVILTGYDDGCWGYKDMEESMGPVQSQAPLGLLALLSEIKDTESYAHAWRQRCRDWAAIPAYDEGDQIKLAQPVRLSDGSTCQIVMATHYMRSGQRRRCYKIAQTGGLTRLSKASLAGSVLISSGKAAQSPVLAEFFAGQGCCKSGR